MVRKTILSLFDGCATAAQALKELGLKIGVDFQYFASEIDEYAIKIAQKNHPEIIQLGDIRGVRAADLPKIDLIVGGSPCQGFSFAGEGLAFDDPRSALFFEFVRVLEEAKAINPDVKFLLENVVMLPKHAAVISKYLGVEPQRINSKICSAQNRPRLYWTNICPPGHLQIPLPQSLNLRLRDIMQPRREVGAKYLCTSEKIQGFLKVNAKQKAQGNAFFFKTKSIDDISFSLTTMEGVRKCSNSVRIEQVNVNSKHQSEHIYSENGLMCCVTAAFTKNVGKVQVNDAIYRLTPIECERLQTLPDNYTAGVSDTQRYKMLGNGMTCAVIKLIFKYL